MAADFDLHIHTTWCDGADAPEACVRAAIAKGFRAIGFSSHAMLPGRLLDWTLSPERAAAYAAEIRALAAAYDGRIRVLCGVEADFMHGGGASPDCPAYDAISPDYVIGSVHYVVSPDGVPRPVDKSPESLAQAVAEGFGGSAEAFIRAYFAQEREMLRHRFDIVGHADLVRKFNAKHSFFDESAAWYLSELEATADAIAASGKIVEVNAGAIARGWMDDAYPSAAFREMLRARGARFVLSSDAHSAASVGGSFARFAACERFLPLEEVLSRVCTRNGGI